MKPLLPVPSHLDPALLRRLQRSARQLLVLVAGITVLQLLFWFWPHDSAVEGLEVAGMGPELALALLLLTASLALDERLPALRAVLVLPPLLVALMTLLSEHAPAPLRALGGPPPHWQDAVAMLLLALVVLLTLPLRAQRRPFAPRLADGLLVLLLGYVVTLLASYFYGMLQIYGIGTALHLAPHTLLALGALGFVRTVQRLPHSFAAILLGDGNAGQVGRVALPIALVLPLLLPALRNAVGILANIEATVAGALAATLQTVLATAVVIWMARRIDRYESELRRLSLLDELTGVHNRRGFMLLTRHALRLARREKEVVTLLFVDVDNLKHVNDHHGHDAGSEMLRAVAGLLEQAFRDSDIVGRLGGDEFCVLAPGANAADVSRRVQQLEARVRDFNLRHRQPYTLDFSTGVAQLDAPSTEAFEAALRSADAAMYRAKGEKKKIAANAPRAATR